jgi:hypothetical protein
MNKQTTSENIAKLFLDYVVYKTKAMEKFYPEDYDAENYLEHNIEIPQEVIDEEIQKLTKAYEGFVQLSSTEQEEIFVGLNEKIGDTGPVAWIKRIVSEEKLRELEFGRSVK